VVPLPVGSSTPSLKFGLLATGLACDHGGSAGVRQSGPAVVAEPRPVVGCSRAGWFGSVSSTMCRVKSRNASAWSLPGVHDAAEQAGVLRGVLREHRQLRALTLAEPDQVVAVVVEEALGGVGERATS
jgi:hypothetical protein